MLKRAKLFLAAAVALIILCACAENDVSEDENINKLADGDLIVRENVTEINIAVSSFDTFNPIMTKSLSVAEFMKTVCEPLFEYDEACNPIGVLANNYAVSADGMTVSFDINPVEFHDSSLLSPADVIYTVNMIRENDTIYSDNVKNVKDIFSDANGRIYIRLSEPVVNFAGMLCFPIVKKGTPAEADPNYIPVGTGAYKYYGKGNSNQVTFSANPDWRGGETGFKNIVVNILKDSDTAVHAFDAGEVDVISSAVFQGNEITPRGEYSVNEYVSNALTFLGINNASPKLSGKYTRKALELLTDREKIVNVEIYSKGEAVKVPINPSAWFYPQLNDEQRDYETVSAMLAKDGWIKSESGYSREVNSAKQTLKLRILVNKDNPEKMRIAQNIAASFNSFGIETELRSVSFEIYKDAVAEKNYELFLGEVMIDRSMDPGFLTDFNDNYFNYKNEELESVLAGMAKSADGNTVMDGAARYAEIFNDEVPFIPLFFRKESVLYNDNISGISPPTNYQIYRDIDKWYISKTK